MLTVYKYPLLLEARQDLWMPTGAKLVDVQLQGDVLTLWALVDDQRTCHHRRIILVGTGHPVPEGVGYIATVQQDGFVWHLFDGGPPS